MRSNFHSNDLPMTNSSVLADFFFPWAPKSLQMVIAATTLKNAYSLEGKLRPT